jgi:hypothetical protein
MISIVDIYNSDRYCFVFKHTYLQNEYRVRLIDSAEIFKNGNLNFGADGT